MDNVNSARGFMDRHERKVDRARAGKASFMSDTKWIRLFQAIEQSGLPRIEGAAQLKCLGDAGVYPFTTHPRIASSGKWTEDGQYGPVRFTDIEWIFIPARREFTRWNRDEQLASTFADVPIGKFKELMDRTGAFAYEVTGEGLRIFGYQ